MPRVVLDTNVLIAAVRSRSSASRRIVEACWQSRLLPVASVPVMYEYYWILSRAVPHVGVPDWLWQLLEPAMLVKPDRSPHLVPEDPEDAKYLATAVAARADAILTNDRHLLVLDPYQGIRIVRPGHFPFE